MACSDVSSLPEVAGGAAQLFEPLDPLSIAAAIEAVLCSPERAGRLRLRGLARASEFNWKKTAERTIEVLRMAAQER